MYLTFEVGMGMVFINGPCCGLFNHKQNKIITCTKTKYFNVFFALKSFSFSVEAQVHTFVFVFVFVFVFLSLAFYLKSVIPGRSFKLWCRNSSVAASDLAWFSRRGSIIQHEKKNLTYFLLLCKIQVDFSSQFCSRWLKSSSKSLPCKYVPTICINWMHFWLNIEPSLAAGHWPGGLQDDDDVI